jgi:hypothetical protein
MEKKAQAGRNGNSGIAQARVGSLSTSCRRKKILFCIQECAKITKEVKTGKVV